MNFPTILTRKHLPSFWLCLFASLCFIVGNLYCATYPALSLLKPGSDSAYDPKLFPESAPRDFQSASSVLYPNAEILFALNFQGFEEGASYFTPPDGGTFYRWRTGLWVWTRKDGSVINHWENGSWAIKINGHVISHQGASKKPGELSWLFPDRSSIQRLWHESSARYHFLYRFEKPEKLITCEIDDEKYWAPLKTNIGRYIFYYSPMWEAQLQALVSIGKMKDLFFANEEKDFGFKADGPVAVWMCSTFEQARSHLSDPNAGTGGHGGMYGVTLFWSNLTTLSSDPILRQAQIQSESLRILFHESTHNLQQKRAYYLQTNWGDKVNEPKPGHWFVEGIADYSVMRNVPRDRVSMYKEIY
jgi:hypothetical protein